jgi:hypothetical protein
MSTSDVPIDEDRRDIDMRLMDYYLADKSNHEVIDKEVEPKRPF